VQVLENTSAGIIPDLCKPGEVLDFLLPPQSSLHTSGKSERLVQNVAFIRVRVFGKSGQLAIKVEEISKKTPQLPKREVRVEAEPAEPAATDDADILTTKVEDIAADEPEKPPNPWVDAEALKREGVITIYVTVPAKPGEDLCLRGKEIVSLAKVEKKSDGTSIPLPLENGGIFMPHNVRDADPLATVSEVTVITKGALVMLEIANSTDGRKIPLDELRAMMAPKKEERAHVPELKGKATVLEVQHRNGQLILAGAAIKRVLDQADPQITEGDTSPVDLNPALTLVAFGKADVPIAVVNRIVVHRHEGQARVMSVRTQLGENILVDALKERIPEASSLGAETTVIVPTFLVSNDVELQLRDIARAVHAEGTSLAGNDESKVAALFRRYVSKWDSQYHTAVQSGKEKPINTAELQQWCSWALSFFSRRVYCSRFDVDQVTPQFMASILYQVAAEQRVQDGPFLKPETVAVVRKLLRMVAQRPQTMSKDFFTGKREQTFGTTKINVAAPTRRFAQLVLSDAKSKGLGIKRMRQLDEMTPTGKVEATLF
jgi:hypothetical protein